MKKILCFLLTLTLLTGILPLNVFAAEDTYTLPEAEYQKILRTAGTGNSVWHEGMSWSSSMSAYQKYCWLKDFRDNVMIPARERRNRAVSRAEEYPEAETGTDDLSLNGMNKTLYRMGQKLNYFIFDLETEITAVDNADLVIQNSDSTVSEKAAAYRRVRKAGERLDAIDAELAKGDLIGTWQSQTDAINGELDRFFDKADELEQQRGLPLLGAGGGSSGGNASFNIIILDTDQIGVEVRTQDLVAIQDAEVMITDGKGKVTGRTDKDGVVKFSTGHFIMDSHNRMLAEIIIRKDGYRIWHSQSLQITGGEGIHLFLEEDNGESYVEYATFRGVDVVHDTEKVYYTPLNDARQSFLVGIHTRAGHQGVFTMTYTSADSTEPVTLRRDVKGSADGITELDLRDTWCSILAPDQPVTMEYHELEDAPTFVRDQAITSEKGVTDRPLKEVTGIPSYVPGTSFDLDIPLGLPGLQSLRLSMKMPWELLNLPVHFSLTPDGSFYFSLAIASIKKITDNANSDSWKTVNSKQSAQTYSDFVCGRKSLTDIAMAGTMRDGAKAKTMDMMKVSFMASFCVMLNGKVTPNKEAARDEDPYKGDMDLFFSLALDAAVSYSFPFQLGPVPCHVGFDLGLGISAGVDLPFTFTATSGGFNMFSGWHNLTFVKEYLDIIISPRVSAAVYAGAGVKGLAGIYLRGYVGLSMNIHIRPMSSDKFTPEATLKAGVEIVAEFLFWSVRATLWSKTWHFDMPRFSGTMNGGGEESPYVEASVTELSQLKGATDFQTVQLGSDLYGFWIEDQTVNGIKRPWLKGAKIEPDDGAAGFSEIALPYLFVGADGKKALGDSVKVVHIDVTSTNEVRRSEGDFRMITLAVTYETNRMVLPFNNREITTYDTEFYNIVFLSNGRTEHYTVSAGKITDESLDSAILNGSVSIAYDEKIQVSPTDHPDYYYYLMYTMTTTGSPTSVHYGIANIYLTPDRPATAPRESFFGCSARKTDTVNFNTSAHPISSVLQAYGIARGMGTGTNDIYVLGELKNSDETVLIARDATGPLDKTQDVQEEILTGDIGAFRYIPGTDQEAGLFAVVCDRDETGRFSLMLTDHRFGADGRPKFTPFRDLGVRIGPAHFDLVDLGASRALYYLESVSVDAKASETGYNIRAIYLSEGSDGKLYASRSFHMAVFDPAQVSMDNGISYLKLFADDAGFVHGFLLEKVRESAGSAPSEIGTVEKFTGEKKDQLKYVSFRETMQAVVRSATPEQVLVKPGDTINVLFSLTNTGNVPASKITLRAYALKDGGTDKIDVADILVNCENPLQSRVIPLAEDLPSATGLQAVSRYDSPFDESGNTFVVNENGNTTVYATEVLMPDETRLYRAGFSVPSDFTPGEYEIFVTFSQMSTRVLLQGNRYDATSAWTKMLYKADSETPQSVIPSSTGSRGGKGGPVTLTMSMNPSPLLSSLGGGSGATRVTYKIEDDGSRPPLLAAGNPGNMNSRFATTAKNNKKEIPLEDADLSIDARLSLEAGQETVHIVIRNEGMADATGIVLDAAVDDEDTLSHSFTGTVLGYRKTVSVDIPLKQITGGKSGETLNLRVSGISPETNLANNRDDLPLNTKLLITRHPQDAFVQEGSPADFTVLARGGKKPYTYQWQVSTSGQNGSFVNLSGEVSQALHLDNVPLKNNGYYYRVIVRDAAGQTVTSKPALLMVKKLLPPTGDRENLYLWLLLSVVTGFPLLWTVLMPRRRKKN